MSKNGGGRIYPDSTEGWGRIVDLLVEKGLITVIDSDSEYRTDGREITHIIGNKVKGWLTVDGLMFNEDPEREELMKLYDGAVSCQ